MVVGRSFTLAIVCAVIPSIALAATLKKGAVVDCEAKREMRVRFYDVGQALAVLVNLPDGRNILVDAGESATRPGCGEVCKEGNKHLLDQLTKDLKGKPISMLWITHQHSDHLGGAVDVLKKFRVKVFVDNGLDAGKRQVKLARQAAQARGVKVVAIGKKGEGLNKTYCHPRQVTVERLTEALGGAGTGSILSFDGTVSCKQSSDSNWIEVPAAEHLWATPRDGDVTLKTMGDGEFVRE